MVINVAAGSTLTVTGLSDDNYPILSCGIRSGGALTFRGGGTGAVSGGTVGSGGTSCGICAGSDITIESGMAVTATGSTAAVSGNLKNEVKGTGWSDVDGTEGISAIPVSSEGRSVAYRKVVFPAAVIPVTGVTLDKTETELTYGGAVAYYYSETADGAEKAWDVSAPPVLDVGTYYIWGKLTDQPDYSSTETSRTAKTFKVTKAEQSAPSPAAIDGYGISISISDYKTLEYVVLTADAAVTDSAQWNSVPALDFTLTGLEAGSTYDFYLRVKEDANHFASPATKTAFSTPAKYTVS